MRNLDDVLHDLYLLVDAIRYVNAKISELPDCNTCADAKVCKYVPELGDPVRINCPFYTGKENSK